MRQCGRVDTFGPVQRVDARGQKCPMPLLMAKRELRELPSGAMLEVLADDRGSKRDFQSLQTLAGHQVVTSVLGDGAFRHLITKL